MSGDTLETQRHFTVDTSSPNPHSTGRLRKQEVRAPTNQRLKKLSCGLFLSALGNASFLPRRFARSRYC